MAFLSFLAARDCGQNTSGLELVAAYRAFFDRSYVSLKARLSVTEKDLSAKFSDKVALTVQKITADNAVLWEFWRQLEVGAGLELPDTSAFSSVIASDRDSAGSLLRSKIANPLETAEYSAELVQALKTLVDISETFAAYNATVRKINGAVLAFQTKQGATDLNKKQAELASHKLVLN